MEHISEHPFFEQFWTEVANKVPDILEHHGCTVASAVYPGVVIMATCYAAHEAGIPEEYSQFTRELKEVDLRAKNTMMHDQLMANMINLIVKKTMGRIIDGSLNQKRRLDGMEEVKAVLIEEHIRTCDNPNCSVKEMVEELDEKMSIV
jgi:hypothetical protein